MRLRNRFRRALETFFLLAIPVVLLILVRTCRPIFATFILFILYAAILLLYFRLKRQSVIQSALKAEIDKQKTGQKLLIEQEKRYRDLFEKAPDAIICTDAEGTIILNNPQTLSLLGFDAGASIVGRKLTEFFVDSDSCGKESIFKNAGAHNETRNFECEMVKSSGEKFTGEIRFCSLLNSADSPVLFFHLRDITAQKSAETEKRRLEEQFRLVYKMEAVGQLAGGIAHDYNNILGAISGYADLIKQRYTEDERLKKYANMILSAANRASELTKKLLTFARKNKLNMAIFDANEALVEIIELLNRTLDKTITISYISPSIPFPVYGDVIHFQNAIMNLALNSRDAMPNGGKLTFTAAVKDIDRSFATHRKDFSIAPGKYFSVSVSDTGCGIDDETLSHLFEPFFTTKDVGRGTGLGLASVYGTVKSHNGFIDVESAVGKGTTFTLYFPMVEEKPPYPVHHPKRQFKAKGHILLVDDESFLRDAVREMLSWLGHTVTSCAGAEEALSLFSSNPESFDLVILDMKMPGMSGMECYRAMKRIKPDIRALISTGYGIEEEKQAILNEGILGIIQKPYVSAQLAQVVDSALQGELVVK